MTDDAGMIPSMTDLNNDCLRRILLFVPVADRIRLRRVCKRFCEISDDCWREVKKFAVVGPQMNAVLECEIDTETFKPKHEPIEVEKGLSGIFNVVLLKTSNQRLIEGVMKRCGEFIWTFGDHRKDRESVLPLLMKYCRKLENLSIDVTSKAEDKQLNQLLALNQKLRVLDLGIAFKNIKVCFRKIPTEFLEELYIETLDMKPPPSILMSQKQIVLKASLLKVLHLDIVDDELVVLIGKKINLKGLKLEMRHADYLTRNGLTPILQLGNLRDLSISSPRLCGPDRMLKSRAPVDDDFLATLAENLQVLRSLTLEAPERVTDKGFVRLASLPKLKSLTIMGCRGITDQFLTLFYKMESLGLMACNIHDAGVIKFLEKSQTIRNLNLASSHITNKSLVAAVRATKKRDNGIRLIFFITDTNTTPEKLAEKSPLLKIVDQKTTGMEILTTV